MWHLILLQLPYILCGCDHHPLKSSSSTQGDVFGPFLRWLPPVASISPSSLPQGANNHSRPHLVFKVHSIVAHIERCTLVCTGDLRQLDADGKTTLSHLFPGRDNEFHKKRPLLLIALLSAWCLIVACWAQFVGRALHRNRPPIISTAFWHWQLFSTSRDIFDL